MITSDFLKIKKINFHIDGGYVKYSNDIVLLNQLGKFLKWDRNSRIYTLRSKTNVVVWKKP